MPRVLPDIRLIHISKAVKVDFQRWREGISLKQDSGREIDELARIVARDRWRLAAQHRRHGTSLFSLARPPYRSVISRYYYAMYHAMRACAYLYHQGDDFEEHSKLPSNIPNDFPNQQTWQNKLKDARLMRNRADYDPYPTTEKFWKAQAGLIRADVTDLLRSTKLYLQGKGCRL